MSSAQFDAVERAITDRSWKDCAVCGAVRILEEWNPPWCSGCGGARVNCIHCGTGRDWWRGDKPPYRCPRCGRNPLLPAALEALEEAQGKVDAEIKVTLLAGKNASNEPYYQGRLNGLLFVRDRILCGSKEGE